MVVASDFQHIANPDGCYPLIAGTCTAVLSTIVMPTCRIVGVNVADGVVGAELKPDAVATIAIMPGLFKHWS